MEKEFLTYEDALALKELGFNEPCLAMFTNRYRNGETYPIAIGQHEGSNIRGDKNSDFDGQSFWYVATPLYSQAFRFFRDNYGLDGRVSNWNNELFYPKIKDVNTPRRFDDDTLRTLTEYKSHKEAEVACIKKLIEVVKGLV